MSHDVTYATTTYGLRMVHRHYPGQTEYCGVSIDAGSRDDGEDTPGLAHFVEHTIFKGTSRHSANYIINRMETVGGELNAFTTKEETSVYAIMPCGNVNRALALLADIITDSRFPAKEIDREREVIADEIDSYLDSPAEAVYDRFEDLIFSGNQLGHNILGTAESIGGITAGTCREYIERLYTAPNMVLFYMGPLESDRFFRMAEKYFTWLPAGTRVKRRTKPGKAKEFRHTDNIDSHQAHTVLGVHVPGMHWDGRYALALCTNILGGPGMNSRLNVTLRERRGLVYTVEASTSLLTDCGLTTIYYGCDPKDNDRCLRLTANELDRLASSPLAPRTLDAAKRQYLGQLAISSDNKENLALATARATLYYGKAATPQETAERIRAITADQLQEAAAMIATAPQHILTLN